MRPNRLSVSYRFSSYNIFYNPDGGQRPFPLSVSYCDKHFPGRQVGPSATCELPTTDDRSGLCAPCELPFFRTPLRELSITTTNSGKGNAPPPYHIFTTMVTGTPFSPRPKARNSSRLFKSSEFWRDGARHPVTNTNGVFLTYVGHF